MFDKNAFGTFASVSIFFAGIGTCLVNLGCKLKPWSFDFSKTESVAENYPAKNVGKQMLTDKNWSKQCHKGG